MNIHEHLRQHLLASLGVPSGPRQPMPDLDELRESQRSPEFERLCHDRMMLGAFRYGLIKDQRKLKSPYDNIGSAIRRLQLYQQTGNREHLCDVANLCMIEFETGDHPKGHFRSVDDGEHTKKKAG